VPPDASVQNLIPPWWIPEKGKELQRGRLVRVFIPHTSQIPKTLHAHGRTADPTDHSKAKFTRRFIDQHLKKKDGLPVAGLTDIPGEVYGVYNTKKRPALVISTGGPDVDERLRRGAARWQSTPAILVAPFYGSAQDGTRGGWNPEFLGRIQACEYPQYFLDWLPIDGGESPSVLRLDHLQPVGNHVYSYELLSYRLTEEAMAIIDHWLLWLLQGSIPEESPLATVFELLADIRRAT
jgi:hypothetical protein